jgi:hypothetical protein
MSAAPPEVNFSDLSNKPVETVRKLQHSPTRSLRVHRRGNEEDLVLTTASRAEQVDEAMSATTKLFVALMEQPQVVTLVTEVLPVAFPWVRFLPKEDVQAFVVDLVGTLKAAESLDNPAPVAMVVTGWRHTAEIYADPELLAALTQDLDGEDFGPVPEPPA